MTFTDDDLRALAMAYALRSYLNSEPHGVASLAGAPHNGAQRAVEAILRAHGVDVAWLDEDPDVRDLMGCTDVDAWESVISLALWAERAQGGE